MTATPQIPTSEDILAPGLTELARLRPAALKFFNLGKGTWANVVAGLKAQCNLELARLAGAAKNGRLSLASGDELLSLVASEFDSLDDPGPTRAVGEVTLERIADFIPLRSTTGIGVSPIVVTSSTPHGFVTGDYVIIADVGSNTAANGLFQVVVLSTTTFSLPVTAVADGSGVFGTAVPQTISGTIPKGFRFRRKATTVAPLLSDCVFETTTEVHCAEATATVVLPLIAVDAGAASNTPSTTDGSIASIEIIDTLFDPLFEPQSQFSGFTTFASGGGSEGVTDTDVKQYAKSFYQGQYAPTDAALMAGAFQAGARHVALSDTGTGTTYLSIADASWASSEKWAAQTRQFLHDNGWVGFGGSVDVLSVVNKLISVTANIVVADQTVLFDTSELVQSARLALTEYLDTRPDWYTWNLAAMRGLLSRLDRKKVLDCLSIEVTDSLGNVLTGPDAGKLHYQLTELNINFLSPT